MPIYDDDYSIDEEDDEEEDSIQETLLTDDGLTADDSLFGTDFDSTGRLSDSGDLGLVTGLDNAKQNIRNWLLTEKGFYPEIDEDYGSEIKLCLGEDSSQPNLQSLMVYVENALMDNPRVQTINDINIYTTVNGGVIVQLNIELVNGETESMNIDVTEEVA